MAGIQEYLNKIKTAVYGREVRQAIHDGIQQCYYDGKAGSTDLEARQRLDSVAGSLSSLGSRMSTAETDIDVLDARVDEIVAPSGQAPSAAEVTDARVGADGTTYTSLGDAVRGQVTNLKSDLGEFKDGFGNRNLFKYAELFKEGYYINYASGHITQMQNADYDIYFLAVDDNKEYTFSSSVRFILPLRNDKYTATSTAVLQNLTSIDVSQYPDTAYIGFSFSKSAVSADTFAICEGTEIVEGLNLPKWFTDATDEIEMSISKVASEADINMFSLAELISDRGYVILASGKVAISQNNNYHSYLVPVDGVSTYKFTDVRTALLVSADKVTAIGSLLSYVKEVDSTGASYIAFSFAPSVYPISDFEIHRKVAKVAKTPFASVSGDIAVNGSLQLISAKTNLRKGERIVFEGDITSFSSIKIGLTSATTMATNTLFNSFVVDATNVSYYARTNTVTPVSVAHGLTISRNIQIIIEQTSVGTYKFTLISDGNLFTHEFTQSRQTIGNPYVLSDNSALTNCKLTWTCADLAKEIWMFGDSYFAYDTARWPYYLHEYDYDKNVLMDGFPGEAGINGRVAFNNLLLFGTPKEAVWCLGMNDGSDSDSAPSTNWTNAKNYFLQHCNANEIEPIFCTIPSVPTINHEQKNAWIRSSGYRYIDFAKAVGATASGQWYSGMLSSDNVHPTEQGARALFARVLLDLPEIMVDDFDY